jgi:hypothetical protein
VYTAFICLMDQCWTLVNTVKNFHVPLRSGGCSLVIAQILAFCNAHRCTVSYDVME